MPLEDIDGDPRVLGLAADIGADESPAYAVSIAKAVAPGGVVLPRRPADLHPDGDQRERAQRGRGPGDRCSAGQTAWNGFLEASSGAAAVDSGVLTWLSTIPAGGVQTLSYGAAIVSGPPAGSVITNSAMVADRTGGVTETLPVTVTVAKG